MEFLPDGGLDPSTFLPDGTLDVKRAWEERATSTAVVSEEELFGIPAPSGHLRGYHSDAEGLPDIASFRRAKLAKLDLDQDGFLRDGAISARDFVNQQDVTAVMNDHSSSTEFLKRKLAAKGLKFGCCGVARCGDECGPTSEDAAAQSPIPPDRVNRWGPTTSSPVVEYVPTVSIIPHKKICGPEITLWLTHQMRQNGAWVRKTVIDEFSFTDLFTMRSKRAMLSKYNHGKEWDFKATVFPKWAAGGKLDTRVRADTKGGDKCPTDCPETITLCGICFNFDIPGNIHFAYTGRFGFHMGFLRQASYVAEFGEGSIVKGAKDLIANDYRGPKTRKREPEWDAWAMTVGFELFRMREKWEKRGMSAQFDFRLHMFMCALVKKRLSRFKSEKNCIPCR